MSHTRNTKLFFLHIVLISVLLCGKAYAQDKKEEPKKDEKK